MNPAPPVTSALVIKRVFVLAEREQIARGVDYAEPSAIRGGASLVHGVQMRNSADKVSM